jgi:hypothetical protein
VCETWFLTLGSIKNDQIDEDGIGGVCSMHGEMRNAFKISVGKLEGKRSLGRSGR